MKPSTPVNGIAKHANTKNTMNGKSSGFTISVIESSIRRLTPENRQIVQSSKAKMVMQMAKMSTNE